MCQAQGQGRQIQTEWMDAPQGHAQPPREADAQGRKRHRGLTCVFPGAAAPKDHTPGRLLAHGLSPLLCPVKTQVLGFSSVQFSSVTQSCPTLCDPMNRSTPGLPVHHQFQELTQTHVNRVRDAIEPSHPLSSPFPPAPNPSQHQSLF